MLASMLASSHECIRADPALSTEPQLRRIHRRLAAAALTALGLGAPLPALPAQPMTVSAATEMQATPGGRPVAVLRAGATVSAGASRGGFTQVTLTGYMDSTLAGIGRDSYPLSVRPAGGAMLRRSGAADAPVVAEFRGGVG